MSRIHKGRNLDGLLILDKPVGLSSNKALQQVKRLLGAAKAGHTGSLDPLASGVLPLCFGEGTKVSQFLLDSDKAYSARVRLGVTTTSGDCDGDVLATLPVPQLTPAQIDEVLQSFAGTITQSPSIYSALKQNGVPLYKLARAGKVIEPKFRQVSIHNIALLAWEYPDFEMAVECSKGTYIRTLAEDIGKMLGCGAHLTMLRRTRAGPFTLEQALTLEEAGELAERGELEKLLLPPDQAIADLPALALDQASARRLCQGQAVQTDENAVLAAVRVYAGDVFLGLGELQAGGLLIAKRLQKQQS